MQCPYNQHHFISQSSLEKHKPKCHYGVVGVASDSEDLKEDAPKTYVHISKKSNVHVHVDAIKFVITTFWPTTCTCMYTLVSLKLNAS